MRGITLAALAIPGFGLSACVTHDYGYHSYVYGSGSGAVRGDTSRPTREMFPPASKLSASTRTM